MSNSFRPVVGTLAYVWHRETDQVLMIRRNARPDDDHFGKVNGLGGKVERDEDIVTSLRREMREEAAIELESFSLRGTVTWSNFGPKNEDWLGFLFVIDAWSGHIPEHNEEGALEWVARSDLLAACNGDTDMQKRLPMWAGDRYFVPLVFDDNPKTFHGTMPYDGDQPVSWTFERL